MSEPALSTKFKRDNLLNSEMRDVFLKFEEGKGREMTEIELDFFLQNFRTSDDVARRPIKWINKTVEASNNIKAELQMSDLNVDSYFICLYVVLFELEEFYQSNVKAFTLPNFDYASTPIGRFVLGMVALCNEFKRSYNLEELIYVEIQRHISGHLNPTGFEINIRTPKKAEPYLDRE